MQKAKTSEVRKKEIIALIDNKMHAAGLNKTSIANFLNITTRTVENRWNDPDKWTRAQISGLIELLNFSDDEIIMLVNDNPKDKHIEVA